MFDIADGLTVPIDNMQVNSAVGHVVYAGADTHLTVGHVRFQGGQDSAIALNGAAYANIHDAQLIGNRTSGKVLRSGPTCASWR